MVAEDHSSIADSDLEEALVDAKTLEKKGLKSARSKAVGKTVGTQYETDPDSSSAESGSSSAAESVETRRRSRRSRGCCGKVKCSRLNPLEFYKRGIRMLGWRLACTVAIVAVLVRGAQYIVATRVFDFGMRFYHIEGPRAQIYNNILLSMFVLQPFWGIVSDSLPVIQKKLPFILFAGFIGVGFPLYIGIRGQTLYEHDPDGRTFVVDSQRNQYVRTQVVPVLMFVLACTAAFMHNAVAGLLIDARFSDIIRRRPKCGPKIITFSWAHIMIGEIIAICFSGYMQEHHGHFVPLYFIAGLSFLASIPFFLGWLREGYDDGEDIYHEDDAFSSEEEEDEVAVVAGGQQSVSSTTPVSQSLPVAAEGEDGEQTLSFLERVKRAYGFSGDDEQPYASQPALSPRVANTSADAVARYRARQNNESLEQRGSRGADLYLAGPPLAQQANPTETPSATASTAASANASATGSATPSGAEGEDFEAPTAFGHIAARNSRTQGRTGLLMSHGGTQTANAGAASEPLVGRRVTEVQYTAPPREIVALCAYMVVVSCGNVALSMARLPPFTVFLSSLALSGSAILFAGLVLTPIIAKVMVFFYIGTSMTVTIDGAVFYFMTDTKTQYPQGPGFSTMFVATSLPLFCAVINLAGFWFYSIYMTEMRVYSLLMASSVIAVICNLVGALQFSRLVHGWFIDHFLILFSGAVYDFTHVWSLMAFLALMSLLCPRNMEAIMVAILHAVAVMGFSQGRSSGALVLHLLGVHPRGEDNESAQFDNLWKAALIHSILPILPLLLLPMLVPNVRLTENMAQKSAVAGSLFRTKVVGETVEATLVREAEEAAERRNAKLPPIPKDEDDVSGQEEMDAATYLENTERGRQRDLTSNNYSATRGRSASRDNYGATGGSRRVSALPSSGALR
ncbi:unnamed protein product [Amoebophrya sp. A25]|nr:unnamed protein product [Amoebophrya sp. A25]|eukprot:GSA25T00026353001.1